MIRLGLDTLCYHMRLEGGEISVEEVLAEAAGLGCECVQLPLHHVRDRTVTELEALRRDAHSLGLTLLVSGNELGRAREGDDRSVAEERVRPWLERTVALGSSTLRVVSGFYRADLAEHPGLIKLERRFVIDALDAVSPLALRNGVSPAAREPFRLLRTGVSEHHRGRRHRPRRGVPRPDQPDLCVREP